MEKILYVSILIFGVLHNLKEECLALKVYKDSYVPSGRVVERVTSLSGCLDYCYYYLTTDRCWAVDFNHRHKRCYVHSQGDTCGVLSRLPYYIHYRFVDCKHSEQQYSYDGQEILQTTPTPKEAPAIHIYETIYSETYINGGGLVPTIQSKDDCYIQCFNKASCKGFDWDFINKRCFFHNEKTVCGQLIHKSGSLHMRLDYGCNRYNPNTCQATAIQELPEGFSRIGGTKIADRVTYEYCVQMCQEDKECNAVDWNIQEKSCWKYTTDEFVLQRDCCLHARKVCNDNPQQDTGSYRHNWPGVSIETDATFMGPIEK